MTTDGHPGYACSLCGHLQATSVACARCGYDTLLDVSRASVRELLHENDQRMHDRYRDRHRMISVAAGMALTILPWLVIPGYGKLRGTVYPGLPFFADQIAFMILIALGVHKLLDRMTPRTKYPWLDGLPPTTAR